MSAYDSRAMRARALGSRLRAEHVARVLDASIVRDFEQLNRLPLSDPGRAAIRSRMALQQSVRTVMEYVLTGEDPGFAWAHAAFSGDDEAELY